MYDQLTQLEKTILTIKKQYQLVSAELTSIKQRPSANDFAALKFKLDNSQAEQTKLKKQLSDFDSRYQSLAEAHHSIGEKQDKNQQQLTALQQQNKALQQQNKELSQKVSDVKQQNINLQEKNRLASERTQVVLDRLTRIDQMDDE